MFPVFLLFQQGWETGIQQWQDKSYSCSFPSSAKHGLNWRAAEKAWRHPAQSGDFRRLVHREQEREGQAWKEAGTAFCVVFLYCRFLPGLKQGRVRDCFEQGSQSLLHSAHKGQDQAAELRRLCGI